MSYNLLRSNVSNLFATIVRQHDYENYLATLFMQKSIQHPVFALRAFDTELSRIPIESIDACAAANKIRFWHETLHDIYNSEINLALVHNNPIVQDLFKICCTYPIPRQYLETLVTSRENLVKPIFFQTYEELETYTQNTASSIFYAILAIAGVVDANAYHVALNLGKAQGIANVLRSRDECTIHKAVMLPNDMMAQYNVDLEEVLRGEGDGENLRGLVGELAYKATTFLTEARSIKIPKKNRELFLAGVGVEKYLKSLQKCNFNMFDKSLRHFSLLPLQLFLTKIVQHNFKK